jgi:hypothetical protein
VTRPEEGRLLGVALGAVRPVDGLEHHHGVVHQHPDAEHQAHHGEDVQALAGEVENPAGGDDRERDRQRDDERGVEPAEEEVEDEDRQQAAHRPGLGQALQ